MGLAIDIPRSAETPPLIDPLRCGRASPPPLTKRKIKGWQ